MRYLSERREARLDQWVEESAREQIGIELDDLHGIVGEQAGAKGKENAEAEPVVTNKLIQEIEGLTLDANPAGAPAEATHLWTSYSQVENKLLQPQRFHHHTPSVSNNYTFAENTGCPPSASDSEVGGNNLMLNAQLRDTFLRYRYTRTSKQTGTQEFLCRNCPHRHWVPVVHFEDHLAWSHGVVTMNDSKQNSVAIPLPTAIFCLYLQDGTKRYHCQCPMCHHWVRLGWPESSPHRLTAYESAVTGLYTNYFSHFMQESCNT